MLAHEMSHVSQRHIARSMASASRQGTASLAAMLLGMVVAARSHSPDMAQAAIAGSQAAAIQGQLNFSRDMEREADRIGFGIFSGAGYAGVGMVGMFDRLQQASRLTDSNQYPYLRSHPLSTERMAEARSRLGLAGAASAGRHHRVGGPAAAWLHAALQGRARGLMDGPRRNAAPLGQCVGPTGSQRAAGHDRELRRRRGRHPPQGLAPAPIAPWPGCAQLAAPYPAVQRVVMAAQLESLIERDRGAEAQALLDSPAGSGLADGSRSSLLLSARVALAVRGPAAQLRRSGEDLQSWLALHTSDAGAWDALAQVHDRLGESLPALRAQAEARWAQGDLNGASDRLRAAQRLARSSGQIESVDATIIESRLKAVEILRRQRLAEERNGG